MSTDSNTPAGFVATSRKAFVAAGAAFVATEGGLIPAFVNDVVAHGLNTGLLFIDLGIGVAAAAVAFAAVWQTSNASNIGITTGIPAIPPAGE